MVSDLLPVLEYLQKEEERRTDRCNPADVSGNLLSGADFHIEVYLLPYCDSTFNCICGIAEQERMNGKILAGWPVTVDRQRYSYGQGSGEWVDFIQGLVIFYHI